MTQARRRSRKAAASPGDDADPNDRGEVTLPLDGQLYHLRPSHEAIEACESKLGRSLFELARDAQTNALSLADMGVIAAEFMHAYGRTHPDDPLKRDYLGAKPKRLQQMIFEAGALLIQPRLAILLFGALTGGVDAQGEWKPVAKKAPEGVATGD